MRNRFYLIKIFALLLFVLSVNCSKGTGGKVIGVKDGDTIEILINNSPVRIRLYGIDCPEKTQPYGTRAKEFTSQLAYGKTVTLREHGKDRYGRVIGEVILPDGRSLNEEILKAGFAWVYRSYTKDAALLGYEENARKQQLGLWKDASPLAPWEFRRGGRARETAIHTETVVQADAKKNFGQCRALTKKGLRCKRKAVSDEGYCSIHKNRL